MPKEKTRISPFYTDIFTLDDALHFEDFRPTLKNILIEADTPLILGVFGPWGSGKTSLLAQLRKEIQDDKLSKVRTTWITAWKYDRHEALWRVFILRVLDALYPREDGEGPREERPRLAEDKLTEEQKLLVAELERLEESVYRPVNWQELGRWTVNWWQALREGGKAAAEIAAVFVPGAALFKQALTVIGADGASGEELSAASKAFRREVKTYHRDQLLHMEQFENTFARVLKMSGIERLVVFVDDLDRCLPEKAIEVLEATKLFLEVPGTVFVLGMDKEVVERGVEARYREWFELKDEAGERMELPIKGESYLQKMVQIPFHLPLMGVGDVESYIQTLEEGLDAKIESLDSVTGCVLARGVYPNPRQVKRAINIFRLLKGFVEQREKRPPEEGGLEPGKIAWPLLAKAILIQHQWPDLYRDWRQYPTLVRSLEEAYVRQPLSDEMIIIGERERRGMKPAEDEKADSEATEVSSAGEQSYRGGLLEPYLAKRRKYALLEQLLAYPPPEEGGDGRMRARFAGLDRTDMETYVYLVSVAGKAEPVEEADAPESLLEEMLSGDQVRLDDAVEQFKGLEDSPAKENQRTALQNSLLNVMNDVNRPVKVRVSAGDSLAQLGDPRFNPQTWNLPDDSRLGFIEVPAGAFLMGSDPQKDGGAGDDEQPQHEISLSKYYIARYPVTVAQFKAFVDDSDIAPGDANTLHSLSNHPVVRVTWHEALKYCEWLTGKLRAYAREREDGGGGEQGSLGAGERAFWEGLASGNMVATLPSEAQWEKAARGTDGRIYPWEGEFDTNKANTSDTGIGRSSAVGCFPGGASPYGMLDMSGNVFEWTRSLWGKDMKKSDYDYPYDSTDSREDLSAGNEVYRMVRGGAFLNSHRFARCAFRRRYYPFNRNGNFGFRVVVCAPPNSER
jgi:formylglycine-generating enzyme required for sulfatase activity